MKFNGTEVKQIKGKVILSICCVCKKILGIKDAEGAKPNISHGYCSCCLDVALEQVKQRRQQLAVL